MTEVVVGLDLNSLIVTPGLFGISDSVDIGNFDTEGRTLVFTESHIPIVIQIPRAASVSEIEAHAQALATTISHELGHTFGAQHQENNLNLRLMDQNPATDVNGLADLVGVGPDGIFGTDDDTDYDFGVDFYANTEGNIGRNDAAAVVAFGLSTGKGQAAFVSGTVFNDRNVNRVFDSPDAPLEDVRDLRRSRTMMEFSMSASSRLSAQPMATTLFPFQPVRTRSVRRFRPASDSQRL